VGLVGVLIFFPMGCRSTRDNQIDILESELRTQEDYIYELEDYLVDYSEKLRQYRRAHPPQTKVESKLPEPELADDHSQEPSPPAANEEPTPRRENESAAPIQSEPEPEQPQPETPEQLEVPQLELEISPPVSDLRDAEPRHPVVATYEQLDEPADNGPADDGVLFIPDPVDFEPSTEAEAPSDEPLDNEPLDDEPLNSVPREAQRLVITQVLRSAGGNAAPTSLLTVVEARDADEEPIDFDGKVSLMIMTLDGDAPRRLKRWDFTPEETFSAWQSSHLGDGLHLELPLDQLALPEGPLELWARLITADGRKLLTQLPFQRDQLATLEVAAEDEDLAAREAPRARKLPAADEQAAAATPRWRPATQPFDAEGFASTKRPSQRWIAQPSGGRMPQAPAVVARRPASGPSSRLPTTKKKPVWTSGRSDRNSPSAPQQAAPTDDKRSLGSPSR